MTLYSTVKLWTPCIVKARLNVLWIPLPRTYESGRLPLYLSEINFVVNHLLGDRKIYLFFFVVQLRLSLTEFGPFRSNRAVASSLDKVCPLIG